MKFVQNLKVLNGFIDLLKGVGPDLFRADVLQNNLSLLRICPKIGLLGDELLIFYFNSLTIVVKDTSSRRSLGPSSLSTCLMSCVMV